MADRSVNASDVTDLELLPKRFDFFVAEMRDAVSSLSETLKTLTTKILDELAMARLDRHDLRERVNVHSERLDQHDARLTALEAVMSGRKAKR